MPFPELLLREAPGPRASLSARADVALFVGLVPRRAAPLPAAVRAALEQAPREPALLELLALAHERNGDDALAAERRALAVQASDAAPGPSLRYAAALAAEGKLSTAESILLDAISRARNDRTLLAALAKPDAFERRSQLRTWLVGILKFKVLDQMRLNAREACHISTVQSWGV